MRALLMLAAVGAAGAPMPLAAAEGASPYQMLFRVINFLILAAGLGYLIKKHAPAFFAARSEAVRRALGEARELKQQADERARSIDERLARLGDEIAGLREAGRSEMAADRERMESDAERALGRISDRAGQEIAAAAKSARQELQAHVAALAVGLAEKQIAGRLDAETERTLVSAFVRSL